MRIRICDTAAYMMPAKSSKRDPRILIFSIRCVCRENIIGAKIIIDAILAYFLNLLPRVKKHAVLEIRICKIKTRAVSCASTSAKSTRLRFSLRLHARANALSSKGATTIAMNNARITLATIKSI